MYLLEESIQAAYGLDVRAMTRRRNTMDPLPHFNFRPSRRLHGRPAPPNEANKLITARQGPSSVQFE